MAKSKNIYFRKYEKIVLYSVFFVVVEKRILKSVVLFTLPMLPY